MAIRTKKRKLPLTPKNTIVLDPVTGRLIQKEHIVHGPKILPYTEATCEECGDIYSKKRKDQRFCSTLCRLKWWRKQRHDGVEPDYGIKECVVCGSYFPKTRPWSKCCSEECRIKNRRRQVDAYLARKHGGMLSNPRQTFTA